MNLRAYLDSLPRGGVTDFARRVGISTVYLSQLASDENKREPSPELSVRIVRESRNSVLLWDCRPKDWHLIWPMLIGQPGAPAIPQEPETQEA